LTATGLDANFWPTPDAARDRFVLVCGLIAREWVSINKTVDDLSPIEKDHLFTVLEEKLDYRANHITDWNHATVVQGPFKKKNM
jgi:hypothetical protein